ncbi:MAG: restriction endonuclease [Thermomicrobiales bacterium]|nr:restriction endonuclease [Thermomicrobiales bacterium]
MPIPDFQTLMLPLVRLLGDGREWTTRDVAETLAQEFRLTPDERSELLDSGRQARFDNRVHWSVTHLAKAGLIERTGRGRIVIAKRGRRALAENLPRIDLAYLNRYPEHQEFRRSSGRAGKPEPTPILASATGLTPPDETPEEAIASSYRTLRTILAEQLREQLAACSPAFFERVVLDVLVAMGYGGSRQDAAEAVGKSGDGGIDGIIKEDRLGLDVVYIQAKRWSDVVGRPMVQAFAGSLEGQRARKGVFITTSSFSQDARDYVGRIEKRIVLVDGDALADLMIEHGVGVTEVTSYSVRRVDADYFDES